MGLDLYLRRRRFRGAVVLLEEGVVQSLHFAFGEAHEPTRDQVLGLGMRLPLPDVLVYVTSTEETLMRRLAARTDRVGRGLSLAATWEFIRRADRVFSWYMDGPVGVDRRVSVANNADDTEKLARLAEHIGRVVLREACR
jgi:hypothetical protein